KLLHFFEMRVEDLSPSARRPRATGCLPQPVGNGRRGEDGEREGLLRPTGTPTTKLPWTVRLFRPTLFPLRIARHVKDAVVAFRVHGPDRLPVFGFAQGEIRHIPAPRCGTKPNGKTNANSQGASVVNGTATDVPSRPVGLTGLDSGVRPVRS